MAGMTLDYHPTGFVDQEETSTLDSIEWTDEKHSLYLKSMEASFVDQLYNSKDLFSWSPVRELDPGSGSQDKFYRTALQPEGVDGYGAFNANPYTRFRTIDNDAFEQQPPLGSGGEILASCGPGDITRMLVDGQHHQVSLNLNEEVSDQNFINENCENRAARVKRAKRARRVGTSAGSINDQVVPFGMNIDEGCSDSHERMIERSRHWAGGRN